MTPAPFTAAEVARAYDDAIGTLAAEASRLKAELAAVTANRDAIHETWKADAEHFAQVKTECRELGAALAEAVALLRRVHSWGFRAGDGGREDEMNRDLWRRRDALLAKHGGAS